MARAAPPREPEGGPADFAARVAALPQPAPDPTVAEASKPPLGELGTDGGLLAGLADFDGLVDDDSGSTGEPLTVAAGMGPEWTAALPEPRPAEESATAAPLTRVLGPVDIIGTQGTANSKYMRTVTGIAAWIVLHPGLDHHALDEAIWPGRDVDRSTRNPWISRLRSLLGSAEDGTKYLSAIATTADARYQLASQVTSDCHEFQDLVAKGIHRIRFRAHHALGDQDGLERAADQLEHLCGALGSDMEGESVELLRSLLAAAAPRPQEQRSVKKPKVAGALAATNVLGARPRGAKPRAWRLPAVSSWSRKRRLEPWGARPRPGP